MTSAVAKERAFRKGLAYRERGGNSPALNPYRRPKLRQRFVDGWHTMDRQINYEGERREAAGLPFSH